METKCVSNFIWLYMVISFDMLTIIKYINSFLDIEKQFHINFMRNQILCLTTLMYYHKDQHVAANSNGEQLCAMCSLQS